MKSGFTCVLPNFVANSLVAVHLCDVISCYGLIDSEEGHRLIVNYRWWLRTIL